MLFGIGFAVMDCKCLFFYSNFSKRRFLSLLVNENSSVTKSKVVWVSPEKKMEKNPDIKKITGQRYVIRISFTIYDLNFVIYEDFNFSQFVDRYSIFYYSRLPLSLNFEPVLAVFWKRNANNNFYLLRKKRENASCDFRKI